MLRNSEGHLDTILFTSKSCELIFENSTCVVNELYLCRYTRNVSEILSKKPRAEEVSELLLEWFHKAWMGLEAAQDWFSVSTTGPYRYQECEGDLYLHWKSKGYTTIFDILTVLGQSFVIQSGYNLHLLEKDS